MNAHCRKQAEKQRKDEVAVGKCLSEIQAVSIIGGFCRANTLNVTFEEDLVTRRLDFQITDKDCFRIANGTISHRCPSGFPVTFIFPRGSLEIISDDALQQCLGEAIGSREPETYRTDRHSVVRTALCPQCLRAHDPSKPIECECGYRTVSVASSPVNGTGVYIFPEPDAATIEEIKRQVRKMNGPMIIPRSVPDWTRVEYESLSLPELQQLRDRLNEIIYDREREKCHA